ncbi:MAG: hypothetical protein INQ03_16665 [Candidatus Heimdallarchaeota archaeon]|nr:hypothetical protein [Candidatus Heimdallarchaeota archaeon]
MPHRIFLLTQAHYPDPLVDYSSTEFIMEFNDAAQLLRQWRNPHLGRSSREGTVLGLAASARASYGAIQEKLLTTIVPGEEEDQLIDKLKVLRFMLDQTLPKALELVNLDQLLTAEDIQEFINQQMGLMQEEYGKQLTTAMEIMNQLNEITDIEITDKFGRKKRISRSDVLDVIGNILGNILLRQMSLWPVDDVIARPRGRLHLKKTYTSAIKREASIPPQKISNQDIRVIDKDRLGLIYFIVDMSQSMGMTVFKDGLTRLDGALLTSLGLYYYFKLINRRKRREFDSFKMHVVPVVKNPYVIADNKKFENFLMDAEAKGKTRLVHATMAAVNHVSEHYKDNNIDVQLVYLTDGRPNVPYDGNIPGVMSNEFKQFFSLNPDTSTPKKAQECMIQLNQIFTYLKNSRSRKWTISYFLMASKKFLGSSLYLDTKQMVSGICRPILIDPTEVDNLGKRILKETMINEQ